MSQLRFFLLCSWTLMGTALVTYHAEASPGTMVLLDSLQEDIDRQLAVWKHLPPKTASEREARVQQVIYWQRYLAALEHHEGGRKHLETDAKKQEIRQLLRHLSDRPQTAPPLAKSPAGGHGVVTGRVTAQATGEAVPYAQVIAEDGNNYSIFVSSRVDGTYTLDLPTPGRYAIRVSTRDFLDEVYDGVPCLTPLCDPLQAGDPLDLGNSQVLQNIDFTLEPGGRLSGSVTDSASGTPIANAEVTVFSLGGAPLLRGVSRGDGTYDVLGVPSGTYLLFAASTSHRDELFEGVPCEGEPNYGGCLPEQGRAVQITVGQTTNIDFALEELGSIAGTVIASDTGLPLADALVNIHSLFGPVISQTFTRQDGTYLAGGLDAGTYQVRVSHPNYLAELHEDIPCPGRYDYGDCNFLEGTQIQVALSQTTTDIDFVLDPLGTITGRITETSTGQPIPFAELTVPEFLYFIGSDQDGQYRIENLAPGSYRVIAGSPEHVDEVYDDTPCEDANCDFDTGNPIEVGLGQIVEGIDFSLGKSGGMTGSVIDSRTGDPIDGVTLQLFDQEGRLVPASAQGNPYTFNDLVPGTYFAVAASYNHQDEVWDNLPCDLGCDPTIGTPIEIVAGEVTEGIDFALDPRPIGIISGRVTDSVSGEPLFYAEVDILDFDGNAVTTVLPYDMAYSAEVPPGTYMALARAPDRISELFQEIPCLGGLFTGCVPAQATPIEVRAFETTENIDFTLSTLGVIEGRVVDGETGDPLNYVHLQLFDQNGVFRRSTDTVDNGQYRFTDLPPGTYFAIATEVAPPPSHGSVLYDGLPCEDGNCDPTLGTPLVIAPATTLTGIDFALPRLADPPYCVPSNTRLCLNGGRFAVEARFVFPPPNSGSGAASAFAITEDTGFFTFLNPSNVELVLKVLDACDTSFNSFWVFAAGLTNVAVEIVVTDTFTDSIQVYGNLQGRAFQPLQDTRAFDTCGAMNPAQSTRPQPSPAALAAEMDRLVEDLARPESKSPSGICNPSPERLCLNRGRFALEAVWQRPNGLSGPAMAVPLTDDTGFFWFFNEQNLESVVKVLDACATPFESFWVFAAGLTNLDVTLRVTDTLSGQVNEYRNQQGVPFVPIQDTRAFESCP